MRLVILGGGLSAISSAYFAQDKSIFDEIILLEKETMPGGLCRSIKKDGYTYDIGPHILFSKDKEMLSLMLGVIDDRNDLHRSNQIIYKERYVQYPFENDLSKLPKDDLDYCVTHFENNPYEKYDADNMLQFFLKTFGEGITNIYLRPYNEKIWKHDPCFMDTQMVDRIPKPTIDEIRRSAAGETVDGYLHQLFFSFPQKGGIEAVIQGFINRLSDKCNIKCSQHISKIEKTKDGFKLIVNGESIYADSVISTIPIQELVKIYKVPEVVRLCTDDLRYNSIIIAFVKTKNDLCGNNFAFMIPDKDIIFHRISKMNFLGEAYDRECATYMIEITYRQGDNIDTMSETELKDKITKGLQKICFIEEINDVEFINITKHQYAYVIYDLHHKDNMNVIRNFFKGEDLILNGRFGNFEYWNMDRVIRESKERVQLMVENIIERDYM